MIIPFDEAFEKTVSLVDSMDDAPIDDVGSHLSSPSYEIAFNDQQFILGDAARSMRIQLEMEKPEWFMQEQYSSESSKSSFQAENDCCVCGRSILLGYCLQCIANANRCQTSVEYWNNGVGNK